MTFVDGVSLYGNVGSQRDLVSVLWNPPQVLAEGDRAVRRLLLVEAGDASDGRVSLFICPECGDLGCGAITARSSRTLRGLSGGTSDTKNTYDPTVDLDSFVSIGPFVFERAAYVENLKRLLLR